MFDDLQRTPDESPIQALAAQLAALNPSEDVACALVRNEAALLADPIARVDAMVAWERHIAWAQAHQLRLIAAVAGSNPFDELDAVGPSHARVHDSRWGVEEVAAALRLSPRSAQLRCHQATELGGRLRRTGEALARGEATLRHATAIIRELDPHDDDTAIEVESRVIERAADKTVPRFVEAVRRTLAAVDAEAGSRAFAKAYEGRAVRTERHIVPGMAVITASRSADEIERMWLRLNAIATADAAQDRLVMPMDARRCDVFYELVMGMRPNGCLDLSEGVARTSPRPSQSGGAPLLPDSAPPPPTRRPELLVTVAMSTLLGGDEAPGSLGRQGVIPASLARSLAEQADSMRFALTDDEGRLVALTTRTRTTGTRTTAVTVSSARGVRHVRIVDPASLTTDAHDPGRPLAEFVIERDQTCVFPGCPVRAERCDLDHTTPHSKDGPTSYDNLVKW